AGMDPPGGLRAARPGRHGLRQRRRPPAPPCRSNQLPAASPTTLSVVEEPLPMKSHPYAATEPTEPASTIQHPVAYASRRRSRISYAVFCLKKKKKLLLYLFQL